MPLHYTQLAVCKAILLSLHNAEEKVHVTSGIQGIEKDKFLHDIHNLYHNTTKIIRKLKTMPEDFHSRDFLTLTDRRLLQELLPDFLEALEQGESDLAKILENGQKFTQKKLIVKAKNAGKFIKRAQDNISPSDLNIRLHFMKEVNKKTVVISFPTLEDLQKYKAELEKSGFARKIIEEQETDAVILVSEINNISAEDLMWSIERVAQEKVTVLQLGKITPTVPGALIRMTGQGYFKLKVQNDKILYVGDRRFPYELAPDGFKFMEPDLLIPDKIKSIVAEFTTTI